MINDVKSIDFAAFDYDSDGVHRGFEFRSPLSINTFRYDLYRKEWTIERILVFEVFIIYTFKYGNPFYKTMKNLRKDLRMTPHTIRKHRDFLIDNGFVGKKLSSEKENYKNIYTVDYQEIINKIDDIYNFEMLPDNFIRDLYIKLFQSYDKRDKREGSYLFKSSSS